jgi:hypothetical protein
MLGSVLIFLKTSTKPTATLSWFESKVPVSSLLFPNLLVRFYVAFAAAAKDRAAPVSRPGPQDDDFVVARASQVLPVTRPSENVQKNQSINRKMPGSSCKARSGISASSGRVADPDPHKSQIKELWRAVDAHSGGEAQNGAVEGL